MEIEAIHSKFLLKLVTNALEIYKYKKSKFISGLISAKT